MTDRDKSGQKRGRWRYVAHAVVALTVMLPDLVAQPRPEEATPKTALASFYQRDSQQFHSLLAFTAHSRFLAWVPELSQKAELDVLTHYVAPRTLHFTELRFAGDSFIRKNVIIRMLHSEADAALKQERRRLAITSDNYSISFKHSDYSGGRFTYVYSITPRRKIPGLLKGEMVLDAVSGSLVRIHGRMAKSPSLFIRTIDIDQDYDDFETFSVPARLHTVIKTRIIGTVFLDVSTHDYSLIVKMPDSRGFDSDLPAKR